MSRQLGEVSIPSSAKPLKPSLEQTVSELENRLSAAPAPPKASLQYRLARLQQPDTWAIPANLSEATIDAYNRGVEAMAAGQLALAETAYREALSMEPGFLAAANNLATLQEQRGQLDEAATTYRQALAYAPQQPWLHRNLGVVYHKMGRIREAYEAFTQYLDYADQPDPTVETFVNDFRKRLAAHSTEPDYLPETSRGSQGMTLIWPKRLNPIPVYIGLEAPEQTVFVPVIEDAMMAWTKASEGRLRFKQVSDPAEARIMITMRQQRLRDPYADVGHAEYQIAPGFGAPNERLSVSMRVHTGLPHDGIPMAYKREAILRLALHEMGHALGLWGHSPDPDDIMHTQPLVSTLSTRDVRTLRRLYAASEQ